MHTVFFYDSGPTVLAAGRGRSGKFRGCGFDGACGGRGHYNGGCGSSYRLNSSGSSSNTSFNSKPSNDGVLGIAPSQNHHDFSTMGRVQCQICHRHGHVAIDCFNRLNMVYE